MNPEQTLAECEVVSEATLRLVLRLRGGAKTITVTVRPRLHKDKWSVYWKVTPPLDKF